MKDAIIHAGRRLYDGGLITAAQGNISVRTATGLLATASGYCKGFLCDDRAIVETDMDGNGEGVSSEIPMHVAIYRVRPDVRAVVHAHPPLATAFANASTFPGTDLLAEADSVLGVIGMCDDLPPGSVELANNVAKWTRNYDVILMPRHGAVTVGASLTEALHRMETLEHLCRVSLALTSMQRTPRTPSR